MASAFIKDEIKFLSQVVLELPVGANQNQLIANGVSDYRMIKRIIMTGGHLQTFERLYLPLSIWQNL